MRAGRAAESGAAARPAGSDRGEGWERSMEGGRRQDVNHRGTEDTEKTKTEGTTQHTKDTKGRQDRSARISPLPLLVLSCFRVFGVLRGPLSSAFFSAFVFSVSSVPLWFRYCLSLPPSHGGTHAPADH